MIRFSFMYIFLYIYFSKVPDILLKLKFQAVDVSDMELEQYDDFSRF